MHSLFQIVRRIRQNITIPVSYPNGHRKTIGYVIRKLLISMLMLLQRYCIEKALLIVISYVPRRLCSIWLSSFRFRFAHVLRVQENIQVADGAEPARARGMRQDLIHLSVLSQHHADEVQSVESPEEGARLLRFNCRRDIQVVHFAIVTPRLTVEYFFVLGRTVLLSNPTMMSL